MNDVERLLILVLEVTSCISISAFALLGFVPVGITSSLVRIKHCAIIAAVKKYNSIIKKEEKANIIEVIISKTYIDSYITHQEFVSVNNVLREYNRIKEE